MATLGKKYTEARNKIDREKRYDMNEALDLLPQVTYAKFDETVEVALRLGVDPRHGVTYVQWDDGSTLSMIPGEDRWEIISLPFGDGGGE